MIETVRILFCDFWNVTARAEIADMVSNVRFQEYRSCMDNLIMPELGRIELGRITTADIDRLLDRASRTISQSKSTCVKALLDKVFHLAVIRGIRPDNPVKNARIIKVQRYGAFRYSEDASVRLLKAFQHLKLANFFTFQFLTGLSKAEVAGLRAGGINFFENAVMIDQYMLRVADHRYVITAGMVSAVNRKIVIPQCAMRVLRCELALRERKHKAAGKKWENLYDLVFTNNEGNMINEVVYRRDLKTLREKFHLDYEGAPSGQKNFGILAVDLKVNAVDLQEYLGYKTASTISNYFACSGQIKSDEDVVGRYYEQLRTSEPDQEEANCGTE